MQSNGADLVFVGSIFQFFTRQRLFVECAPSVENVGQHEGDQQRYVSHRAERKLRWATIHNRQRTLYIGRTRIVARIIIARQEQQSQHGEHHAYARRPNASARSFFKDAGQHTIEHEHHAY